MTEILTFFRIIISKFFARDTLCPELIDLTAGLFDWQRSLHQRVFQQYTGPSETGERDYRLSAHYRRVQAESGWRLAELKVGDQVDAVKATRVRDATIRAWSRGTVVFKGIPGDDLAENEESDQNFAAMDINSDSADQVKVDVKFESDKQAHTARFDLADWRIAPPGTFAEDFDWRYDLEVGSLIDCMDDEKDWYKSTVMAIRSTCNADGDEVPEIYVGFRTFDEEGSKTDDEGRKFFGWSDRYDAWLAVTDVQVQRFHSCHSQYRKAEAQNRSYDRPFGFEDREDVLYATQGICAFAAARRGKHFGGSFVISDALDDFGHQGGFAKLLGLAKEAAAGRAQLSMDLLTSVTRFLCRVQPLWHRQFAIIYIQEWAEWLLKAVCYINK